MMWQILALAACILIESDAQQKNTATSASGGEGTDTPTPATPSKGNLYTTGAGVMLTANS